jgi:hypothetical protein
VGIRNICSGKAISVKGPLFGTGRICKIRDWLKRPRDDFTGMPYTKITDRLKRGFYGLIVASSMEKP